jgi:hypothetical protein
MQQLQSTQRRASSGAAPLLLRLPRELRDMIYDYVLTKEILEKPAHEDPYDFYIRDHIEPPGTSLN